MDNVFFIREDVFGNFGAVARRAPRGGRASPSPSERAYFVLLATVFGAVARRAARPAAGFVRAPPVGPAGQPGGLHDDGPRHHRHQAAGVRAVVGHRRRSAGRSTPGSLRPPPSADYEMFYEPPARAARRPRRHHGGERRARRRARPGRVPGAGRQRVVASRPRHPRPRAHRRHPGAPARRPRAAALRHLARSWWHRAGRRRRAAGPVEELGIDGAPRAAHRRALDRALAIDGA